MWAWGYAALKGTQEGNSAADVAQRHWAESAKCVPAYRSHLGFYGDETAVHLDGSRPQDDDSIFVTDQTPKPPSDSDSSGTFARAVENNQAIPGYEVVRKLGSAPWPRSSWPAKSAWTVWWQSKFSPAASVRTRTTSNAFNKKEKRPPN